MTNPRVLEQRELNQFLRGWFHGARNQIKVATSTSYLAGHEYGTAWLEFHGSDRTPNLSHAEASFEVFTMEDKK